MPRLPSRCRWGKLRCLWHYEPERGLVRIPRYHRSGKIRSGQTDEHQTSGPLRAEGPLMLTLPEEHRKLFQEPFGDLHRNINEILPLLEDQIVYSVGDVVTHN